MKIKKSNLVIAASFAAATLLSACQHNYEAESQETVDDCSAIFETRDPSTNKKAAKKTDGSESAENQPIKQCKILEVKLDDETKCEIVGSNKIDNLKQILAKNSKDKTVLVVPEKKFRESAKQANSFLKSKGIDIEKHFDLATFDTLDFPYKGIKCVAKDKKYVLWSGNKQVIFTIVND